MFSYAQGFQGEKTQDQRGTCSPTLWAFPEPWHASPMPGTWMQEAKVEAGNAPHMTLEAFCVLLGSSTPVSVLKAPQPLGRLLCPKPVMLSSPEIHLPNALNHSVGCPCGINLHVPTRADLTPRFGHLSLLVSAIYLQHPCTPHASHLQPDPVLGSTSEKSQTDKTKGHLRKNAPNDKLPRWGVGVEGEDEGCRKGRGGACLHSTTDSLVYIHELSLKHSTCILRGENLNGCS